MDELPEVQKQYRVVYDTPVSRAQTPPYEIRTKVATTPEIAIEYMNEDTWGSGRYIRTEARLVIVTPFITHQSSKE